MKQEDDINYCGFGASKWFYVPNWKTFQTSCKIHDDNYGQGGTKEDRLKADLGFLWRMLEDANKIEDYKRKRLVVINALLYYILVRLFGWISFNRIKK